MGAVCGSEQNKHPLKSDLKSKDQMNLLAKGTLLKANKAISLSNNQREIVSKDLNVNPLVQSKLKTKMKSIKIVSQSLSIIDQLSSNLNKEMLNKFGNIYNALINPQLHDDPPKELDKERELELGLENDGIEVINQVIRFNFYYDQVMEIPEFSFKHKNESEFAEQNCDNNLDKNAYFEGPDMDENEYTNINNRNLNNYKNNENNENILERESQTGNLATIYNSNSGKFQTDGVKSNISEKRLKTLEESINGNNKVNINSSDNYKPIDTLKSNNSNQSSKEKPKLTLSAQKGIKNEITSYIENAFEILNTDTLIEAKKKINSYSNCSKKPTNNNQNQNQKERKNSRSSKKGMPERALTESRTDKEIKDEQPSNNEFYQNPSLRENVRANKENYGSLFRDPNLDFDFDEHIHQETAKIKSERLNKMNNTGQDKDNTSKLNKNNKDIQEYVPNKSNENIISSKIGANTKTSQRNKKQTQTKKNEKVESIPVYKPLINSIHQANQAAKFTTTNVINRVTLSQKVSNNTSLKSKNLNKSKLSQSRITIKGKTTTLNEREPKANIKINLKELIKENVKDNYLENNRYGNLQIYNISTIAKNKSYISPNLNTFQDCIDKFTFTDKSNRNKKSPIKSMSRLSQSKESVHESSCNYINNFNSLQ